MDIGKRLRQFRESRGLSEGDIEKRTGIFRCYVSRVELGYIDPQLPMLEKWTKGLGITLVEFFAGTGLSDEPAKVARLNSYEMRLFNALRQMSEKDRRLFLHVARTMAGETGRKSGGGR